MIRLLINGLAASAGGGLTYLRNVIPHLSQRVDAETTVLLNAAIRQEFGPLPNISFVEAAENSGPLRRFVSEQTELPRVIRQSGAQILISAGNFALWNSPIPQILLSRNSLYVSDDFRRDLRSRGAYALLIDTWIKGWLARRSIIRSDLTVAPSDAFARQLSHWSGRRVLPVYHGFDAEAFTSDITPLPSTVEEQLRPEQGTLRLLFVSHYNYYRNFETLFRAMPILNHRLKKRVKLFLTCHLKSGNNPGNYRTHSAAALANTLREHQNIVELGMVPYRSLHLLYRACNVYVTPAYAESFAHPLIESMSSGLPVVASDLAVHREICGDAAVYFPRFSPEALAEQVLRVDESPKLAQSLSCNGLQRSRDFSWSDHVERLVGLAHDLLPSGRERN